MYIKCRYCKETYIDEDEEICVECSNFFTDEARRKREREDDYLLNTVGGDELGFIDVHVSVGR